MTVQQQPQNAPGATQSTTPTDGPRGLSAMAWRAVSVGVVAAAVAAVLYAGWQGREALKYNARAVDYGENLSVGDLAQLDQNRAALEAGGLAAGMIYVRDFAAVDGDAVIVNGTAVPLTSAPTPLEVGAGPLVLVAAAGSTGCVTVEVGDASGVYQLCLRDGDPIGTFTVTGR